MKTTTFDLPHAEVRVEARLSSEDRAALGRHVQTVHEYQAKSVEAACALAAILYGKLYVEAGDFPAFALQTFGIRRRRAYQLAQSGHVYAGLRDAGVRPLPRNEAQIRPLAELKDADDRRITWNRALAKAGGDPAGVTKEDVENAVAEASGRRGTGTERIPIGVGLAAVERALSDTAAPTEKLYEKHHGLLGLLDPEDQAKAYDRARVAGDATGTAEYGSDLRLEKVPLTAVKRAVRDLASELPEDVADLGPADPVGLAVLMEQLLVGDAVPNETPVVGGSYLAPYAGSELLVDTLTAALDRDGGIPEGSARDHRETVSARRRMVRCRLEPEVAAWTWPVLTPAARRTATAWFPDPAAPPPCYIPARLTQPANTRPKTLDTRTPTARSVLLAPGVDLLRGDVPDEIVDAVMARASAAEHLVFLAAVCTPDRVVVRTWPANVLPAIAVQGPCGTDAGLEPDVQSERGGPEAVARALEAFGEAGVLGALVLDDYGAPLPDDLLDQVRDRVRVIVLRGAATDQRLYDQVLGLRPAGVLMIAAADVRCRPWDALLAAVPERPARAAATVTAVLPRPQPR